MYHPHLPHTQLGWLSKSTGPGVGSTGQASRNWPPIGLSLSCFYSLVVPWAMSVLFPPKSNKFCAPEAIQINWQVFQVLWYFSVDFWLLFHLVFFPTSWRGQFYFVKSVELLSSQLWWWLGISWGYLTKVQPLLSLVYFWVFLLLDLILLLWNFWWNVPTL